MSLALTAEEAKSLARRNFEEFDNNNVDGQIELYAPDATIYAPQPMDRDGFRNMMNMFKSSFPDGAHTIEDQITDGEQVCTRWTWSGTHTGDFMGMPPTGRRVSIEGMNIDRIASGKIIERWIQYDALGLVQQLTAQQ